MITSKQDTISPLILSPTQGSQSPQEVPIQELLNLQSQEHQNMAMKMMIFKKQ